MQASFPIYSVDSKYRIRSVNRGCERLTNLNAVDLVGKQCRYSSQPGGEMIDLLLGALCPPAAAFQGQVVRHPITIPKVSRESDDTTASGGITTFKAIFLPIIDSTDDNESTGNKIVVTILLPFEHNAEIPVSTASVSLHAELLKLRLEVRKRFSFESLIGQTPVVQSALRTAKVASQCLETVHFIGERGTGKLHWARAVHQRSPNQQRSFVPMDCRRLSSLQIRRILKRLMMFDAEETSEEMAPGTIFFSHIDHLALDVQVEVRDMLEGSAFPVRLMSSSLVDLQSQVEHEEFDKSLFYSISTITIQLPTMVDRYEDLPLLAQEMLERCNSQSERQIDGFSDEVLREFQRYAWPANIAELDMVVREAHKKCQSTTISLEDLPFRFHAGIDAQSIGPAKAFSGIDLEQYLKQVEFDQIQQALTASRQNKTKAAKLLGLTRARLYRRMEQLGITDEE